MKKLKIFLIPFFACLLLSSCDQIVNSEPNIRREEIIDGSVMDNYFPNSPGDYWVYKVVNAMGRTIDKLTITVSENQQSNGKNHSTVWTASYEDNPSWNTTRYVEVKHNAVYMYDTPDATRGAKMYEIPLSVGNKWYVGRSWDSKFIDSAKVISYEEISYGDMYFEEAYFVTQPYYDESSRKVRTLEIRYFVPYVGLVFRHFGRNYTHERKHILLDYSVGN